MSVITVVCVLFTLSQIQIHEIHICSQMFCRELVVCKCPALNSTYSYECAYVSKCVCVCACMDVNGATTFPMAC